MTRPAASLRRLLAAGLLGVATMAACGGGALLISFNSGVVASTPVCGPTGGNFDLRDQGGLVVLVVISSRTLIYARSGAPAVCDDIFLHDPVDVRGSRDGDRLNAQDIYLR